jgi:heme exporter protein D
MRFESFSAFLHMDGQGIYIWAAYGLTLVILAANVWWPMMARRNIIRAEKSAVLKSMNSRKPEDRS